MSAKVYALIAMVFALTVYFGLELSPSCHELTLLAKVAISIVAGAAWPITLLLMLFAPEPGEDHDCHE